MCEKDNLLLNLLLKIIGSIFKMKKYVCLHVFYFTITSSGWLCRQTDTQTIFALVFCNFPDVIITFFIGK